MKSNIYIILVNWNSVEDTLECISSLSKIISPQFAIVVIDNGSLEDEAETIKHHCPEATIVKSPYNTGFTGGNNIGIKYSLQHGADYILCLNNDTVVAPNFLARLLQCMEENPQTGIATSLIYEYENPSRITASGCSINFEQAPPVTHISHTNISTIISNVSDVWEVPFAEGCVLFMRRIVAEQVLGFDDDFFAYLEDADLCLRAKRFGWACTLVADAHVWHKSRKKEVGCGSPTAIYYSFRNGKRLLTKHGTKLDQRIYCKAEIKCLRNVWRKYLRDYIISGKTEKNILNDVLLPQTLGIIAGLFKFKGNRKKYVIFEKCMGYFVTIIAGCLIISATPIIPLFKLRECYKNIHISN